MRKSISIIAAVTGLMFAGPAIMSPALAGISQSSFLFFSSTAKSYSKEQCKDEKPAKEEQAEPDKSAKSAPTGPEPLYFGF